jgi:hypothetical protein
MGIAFVIKEMSGRSASVIKYAHCINKQFCAQEVMKLILSEEQFLSLRANFAGLVCMNIYLHVFKRKETS